MSALLDASALLNIIRFLGPSALDHIRGCYVLTLTPYEVGNAVWKEATLLKRITLDEALVLLNLFSTIQRFLNTAEPRNIETILRLAYSLKITYYDASYLATAGELGLTLVTDDTRLKKRVEAGIDVVMEVFGRKVEIVSSKDYTSKRRQ